MPSGKTISGLSVLNLSKIRTKIVSRTKKINDNFFITGDSTATSFDISKEKSKTHSNKSPIDTHGTAASTSKKIEINSITSKMSDAKISASTNE
ncbi:unnamed protein product, partial [Rotaria magnacalcarata]